VDHYWPDRPEVVVFFYELTVRATGGDDALSSFVQNYGLVPRVPPASTSDELTARV
jgi:hypothetical protein